MLTVDSLLISVAAEGSGGRIGRIYSIDDKPQEIGAFGRIGRGPFQSYCVLVSDTRTEESRARLKVLCDTADGFQIAEADLRQRGPGDFFGNRQHGLPALHIADLGTNMAAVNDARDAARAVLAADPTLCAPEHAALRAQCARLFAANDGHFN